MELSNAPGAVTLALHTNDFDAAMRFYSDILGFVVDIDEWIGEGVIERPFRRLRLLLTEDGPLALEFLADGPAPAVGSPPVSIAWRKSAN